MNICSSVQWCRPQMATGSMTFQGVDVSEHEEVHHDGHVSGGWVSRLRRAAHVVRPHSHDAADSVDGALEASARGIAAVKISLVILGVTALAQALLVVVTGSVALLA